MNTRRRVLVLTSLGFLSFFLFGFTDNMKGPMLPDLLADLRLSYTGGSSLLVAVYVGFLTGVLASGPIAARKGNRQALMIAGFAIAAGTAGNAFGAPYPLLFPAFFLIGFGLGSMEVGANGLIVDLYPEKSGKYLNLLAVFHGAGSMAAPFIAGFLLAGGATWRNLYALVIPLALAQAILLVIFKSPGNITAPARNDEKLKLSLLLQRDVLLYALFLAFYVAGEIGIASWMVDYLLNTTGYSVSLASGMLSIFFACLMAGRVVGSFLIERVGYRRALIWAVSASILCFGGGLLLPEPFAFLIPGTGFFFSIIFPTVTADAAGRAVAPRGAVFSVLFFFAGLGSLVGPWLVGLAADSLTIRGAFPINLIFLGMLLPLLLLLKPRGLP